MPAISFLRWPVSKSNLTSVPNGYPISSVASQRALISWSFKARSRVTLSAGGFMPENGDASISSRSTSQLPRRLIVSYSLNAAAVLSASTRESVRAMASRLRNSTTGRLLQCGKIARRIIESMSAPPVVKG